MKKAEQLVARIRGKYTDLSGDEYWDAIYSDIQEAANLIEYLLARMEITNIGAENELD